MAVEHTSIHLATESPMKTGGFGEAYGYGQMQSSSKNLTEDENNSLFDELENIFSKNKKWLDEQREREYFLREMA